MCQARSAVFNFHAEINTLPRFSDNANMVQTVRRNDILGADVSSWAMRVCASSLEKPDRLVQTLTGAILGCGGWVLSRGTNDSGVVTVLFEFERQACVDIYSILIAAGLDLSRSGHMRFTELCQCTVLSPGERGHEIASVDLEIQTPQPNSSVGQSYVCE